MINQNQAGLTLQVWSILTPVLLIGVYAFGVNMVTEGLGAAIAAAIDRRTAT